MTSDWSWCAGKQGCGIESAGAERIPDLGFVITVPDRSGLPVFHDEKPVHQTVDFRLDKAEQGSHIRTPGPVSQALDLCAGEHRDTVIEPCAVTDDFILPARDSTAVWWTAVDGIVRIPAWHNQVDHFVQQSF